MGRKPGSGRKKGSRNKRGLELVEMAQELGVEPFEIMLLFAKGDWKALGYKQETYVTSDGPKGTSYKNYIEPETRLDAAAHCSKYLYPQLKSVEVKDVSEPKGPIVVKVQWDDESGNNSEDEAKDAPPEEIP